MAVTAQIVLFAVLSSFATGATAAKWVGVAEGSTRAVYLDTENLQRDGKHVRAWVREVYTSEQRSPETGVLYYSANALVNFDCSRRKTNPMVRIFFGGEGTELRRVNLEAVDVPVLADPGSIQEQLLDRACRPPQVTKVPAERTEKKPAENITKVALAETKSKTDAPPGGPDQKITPIKLPAKPDVSAKAAEKPKTTADGAKPATTEKPKSATVLPPKAIERKLALPAALRNYMRPPPRGIRPATAKREHKEPEADENLHWSYGGKSGPAQWGSLNSDYAACAKGKRQSPIDIRDGAKLALEPIRFDYQPSTLRIVDNGHTVQVNYGSGSSITVAGVRYDLLQFHFHKPSEERIDGKVYDMVAHLVHGSIDGRYAVVAVLFEAGEANPFINALWPYLPLESGREFALPEVKIDIDKLLPAERTYYAYMGSLTTPPCTEGVLWLVLKNAVPVAREQVQIFGKLYSMNARPVQPANGRLIKESL